MKNLFLILTVSMFVFQSCSSDDSASDESIHPLAGNWSGSFSGDDSGTWAGVVSNEGIMETLISISNKPNSTVNKLVFSTLNDDWSSNGEMEDGTRIIGKFTSTTFQGTWTNPNNLTEGTFVGNKN